MPKATNECIMMLLISIVGIYNFCFTKETEGYYIFAISIYRFLFPIVPGFLSALYQDLTNLKLDFFKKINSAWLTEWFNKVETKSVRSSDGRST